MTAEILYVTEAQNSPNLDMLHSEIPCTQTCAHMLNTIQSVRV